MKNIIMAVCAALFLTLSFNVTAAAKDRCCAKAQLKCCKKQKQCCKENAACCKYAATANKAADCCKPGAECCKAEAKCCDKNVAEKTSRSECHAASVGVAVKE